MAEETVNVRLVQHGEATVPLTKADLDEALTDPDKELLSELLAPAADSILTESMAVLPDGTLVDVFRVLVRERPSLRADHAAALTAVIAAARPDPDCGDCATRACPAHIAEALMTAYRQERLAIVDSQMETCLFS